MDRVRSLIEEKRALTWKNQQLTTELSYASTPAPYVFVDLQSRAIEFRVRGKAHKIYHADAIEVLGDEGKPISQAALHSLAPNPVEVLEKAGGPPELKPPPASAPDANGSNFTGPDPNAGPVQSDAGILGVDAPTNYDVALEGSVTIQIRTVPRETRWEKIRGTFSEALAAFASALRHLTGGGRPETPVVHSAAVRVTFDEESAKAFYHSILPTEHVFFLPAPPPPVELVATLNPSPAPAR